MTTKSMAEKAFKGLVSTNQIEREEAVYAMSRMTDEEIFYEVVEKAPIETEVFIDRMKLRISQLEADLAMHKAALLGAEQALECYRAEATTPPTQSTTSSRGSTLPMAGSKQLPH